MPKLSTIQGLVTGVNYIRETTVFVLHHLETVWHQPFSGANRLGVNQQRIHLDPDG